MHPKVSVMMPAKNAGNYLSEAIESILKQTHENLELLIVDDKSTDNTREIAETFKKKDTRIRILYGDGICAANARNKAIDAASGEYIMNMDSDDVATPDRISRLLEAALHFENPVIGSNVYYMDHKLNPIKKSKFPLTNHDIRVGIKRPYNRCTIMPGTILTKLSILKKYRYREFYIILEDWDLILRMYEDELLTFENIPELLYLYRRNKNSATMSYTPRIRYNLFIRYNEIQRRKSKPEIYSLEEFEAKVKKSPTRALFYHLAFLGKQIQHGLLIFKTKYIMKALKA
jgi:glycosyltransferase involved in cell wall biosynthesis